MREKLDEFLDLDCLRSLNVKPFFFGLGFIQAKIDATKRIHFWHPELTKIVGEEEVHNHRYNFKSWILGGQITHRLYEIVYESDLAYGNKPEYELIEVTCSEEKSSEPRRISKVNLKPLNEFELNVGSSYTIKADEFHVTDTSGAITLLERGPILYNNARVIKPLDTPTICPFSKKIPESELWEMMADLKNRLHV